MHTSDPEAKFALVQNYFVYNAARCQDGSSDDCKKPPVGDQLKDYQRFTDLQIVLPMYYGRIQIITTENSIGDEGGIDSLGALRGKRVYLGTDVSVNGVYGREILSRHPELLIRPYDQDAAPKRRDESTEKFLDELRTSDKKPDDSDIENIRSALEAAGAFSRSPVTSEPVRVAMTFRWGTSCAPPRYVMAASPSLALSKCSSSRL